MEYFYCQRLINIYTVKLLWLCPNQKSTSSTKASRQGNPSLGGAEKRTSKPVFTPPGSYQEGGGSCSRQSRRAAAAAVVAVTLAGSAPSGGKRSVLQPPTEPPRLYRAVGSVRVRGQIQELLARAHRCSVATRWWEQLHASRPSSSAAGRVCVLG